MADDALFLVWITRDFISFGARFGENGRRLRYTRRITDSSTTDERARLSAFRRSFCGKRRVRSEAEKHEALVRLKSPLNTWYNGLEETEDAEVIDALLASRRHVGFTAFTREIHTPGIPYFELQGNQGFSAVEFCRTRVNDAREVM